MRLHGIARLMLPAAVMFCSSCSTSSDLSDEDLRTDADAAEGEDSAQGDRPDSDNGDDAADSDKEDATDGSSEMPREDAAVGAGEEAYQPAYEDALLKEPYVDVDEWRDEPVRHRYVHGGFKGSDARFSIHFPPEDNRDKLYVHGAGNLLPRSARQQSPRWGPQHRLCANSKPGPRAGGGLGVAPSLASFRRSASLRPLAGGGPGSGVAPFHR